MTTEIIRYAVDADDIATLTLDYPGKTMNVIDQAFMDCLDACIERIKSDDKVRGAIITSGKDSFVAGADLMGMKPISTPWLRCPWLSYSSPAHRCPGYCASSK